MKEYIIRLEKPADFKEVENLTREAFWNIYRPGCTEHYVLHCFRDNKDFIPQLDFVMEIGGKIMGHIMYAKAEIQLDNGEVMPAMTFGPMSIAPEYKRQGYGKILLDYSLDKATKFGAQVIAITGNIDFYSKCGFVVAKTYGIRYWADEQGDAPYFLIKELKKGVLNDKTGVFKEPDGYFIDDKKVDEFDKDFPYKEKQVLKGQLFN